MLTNDNTESRRMVEQCYKRHKTNINPIIDWTDGEVWEFIRANDIPYCELYNEGFHRLGCIGCPLARTHGRNRQFARWPKYKDSYIRAFARMLVRRNEQGRPFIIGGQTIKDATPHEVFNWWMEYDVLPGQFNLFEDYEEEEDT